MSLLLEPSVRRSKSNARENDVDVSIYLYQMPFDQARVQHALESLFSLVRTGGPNVTRTAKGALVRSSTDSTLIGAIERGKSAPPARYSSFFSLSWDPIAFWRRVEAIEGTTYLEVLVQILIR